MEKAVLLALAASFCTATASVCEPPRPVTTSHHNQAKAREDLSEPPIGIEPMTYALRVKRESSRTVQSGARRRWRAAISPRHSTVIQDRPGPLLAPALARSGCCSDGSARPVRWQVEPNRRKRSERGSEVARQQA
jgi:hypothetical protein